jgi:acyl carrier protein
VVLGVAYELKRLVGYVVSREGVELKMSELKSYLQQNLPEHMVPKAIAILNEIPLTINGKIDRRALPDPMGNEDESYSKYEKARDAIEETLVTIWQEVLGLERVGINDNFFELGGHSLLIIQIVSRVQQLFGTQISVNSFFQKPTVADMAEHIKNQQISEQEFQELEQILNQIDQLSEEEVKALFIT